MNSMNMYARGQDCSQWQNQVYSQQLNVSFYNRYSGEMEHLPKLFNVTSFESYINEQFFKYDGNYPYTFAVITPTAQQMNYFSNYTPMTANNKRGSYDKNGHFKKIKNIGDFKYFVDFPKTATQKLIEKLQLVTLPNEEVTNGLYHIESNHFRACMIENTIKIIVLQNTFLKYLIFRFRNQTINTNEALYCICNLNLYSNSKQHWQFFAVMTENEIVAFLQLFCLNDKKISHEIVSQYFLPPKIGFTNSMYDGNLNIDEYGALNKLINDIEKELWKYLKHKNYHGNHRSEAIYQLFEQSGFKIATFIKSKIIDSINYGLIMAKKYPNLVTTQVYIDNIRCIIYFEKIVLIEIPIVNYKSGKKIFAKFGLAMIEDEQNFNDCYQANNSNYIAKNNKGLRIYGYGPKQLLTAIMCNENIKINDDILCHISIADWELIMNKQNSMKDVITRIASKYSQNRNEYYQLLSKLWVLVMDNQFETESFYQCYENVVKTGPLLPGCSALVVSKVDKNDDNYDNYERKDRSLVSNNTHEKPKINHRIMKQCEALELIKQLVNQIKQFEKVMLEAGSININGSSLFKYKLAIGIAFLETCKKHWKHGFMLILNQQTPQISHVSDLVNATVIEKVAKTKQIAQFWNVYLTILDQIDIDYKQKRGNNNEFIQIKNDIHGNVANCFVNLMKQFEQLNWKWENEKQLSVRSMANRSVNCQNSNQYCGYDLGKKSTTK